jgi:hypothetical protein
MVMKRRLAVALVLLVLCASIGEAASKKTPLVAESFVKPLFPEERVESSAGELVSKGVGHKIERYQIRSSKQMLPVVLQKIGNGLLITYVAEEWLTEKMLTSAVTVWKNDVEVHIVWRREITQGEKEWFWNNNTKSRSWSGAEKHRRTLPQAVSDWYGQVAIPDLQPAPVATLQQPTEQPKIVRAPQQQLPAELEVVRLPEGTVPTLPIVRAPQEPAPVVVAAPSAPVKVVTIGVESDRADQVRQFLVSRYGQDNVKQSPGVSDGRPVAAFQITTAETQQQVIEAVRGIL